MSSHQDVPAVSPRWSPSHLSARDIVMLVQGDAVSGVDSGDWVVRQLLKGLPNPFARMAFRDARKHGYLFISANLYTDTWITSQLRDVWGWWCGAAGHPNIILSTVRGSDVTRITCDVSPTGREWSFDAFAAIGKLLEPLATFEGGTWLFTNDELQLSGVEMEDAIHITRALVDLGTAGRFREGVYDEGFAPEPRGTHFPTPMSPIDRTSG